MAEDDAVDMEPENSSRFEEYEWCGQKRIRATTLLEGGFRGIKQLATGQWHSDDQVTAGAHGNHCWWGFFVAVLPACDVHIKVVVFGWGNGIVRLQASNDEGGSRPRVMH